MEAAVHQIVRDSEKNSFNTSHHNILPYFRMIQNGDMDQLMKTLDIRLGAEDYQREIGTDNDKETEYMAVSLVNTFMIAAILGGVFPTDANWTADRLLQRIAVSTDRRELSGIIRDAAYQFCEKVRTSMKENTDNIHVEKARQYIRTHLTQNIRIDDIADAAGISRYHLSRLFREKTGKTLAGCLADERISAAKEMLALTDSSISEIAHLLQFCDESYFISVFRKKTGTTPARFRQNRF